MADPPNTILPDCNKLVISDSDASAPSLTSLPVEILDSILEYLLPDKPILRLRRGWLGRFTADGWPIDPFIENFKVSYRNYTGDVDVRLGEAHYWQFDDEFRFNKQRVQTAVLRVNRYLYNVGSRLLYGRTLKVDIWSQRGSGLTDQRSVYMKLRGLPWAKMRKILITVHSAAYMQDVERLRKQLLILCEFLVSSDSFIKNLHVFFTGEWDPDKKFLHPHGSKHDPFEFGILDCPWTISTVEQLSMMLEPLRQLKRVQECEIELPVSVQENPRLIDEVHRCIRDIKGEERSVEPELPEDWEKDVSLEWEEKDRREKYTDPDLRDDETNTPHDDSADNVDYFAGFEAKWPGDYTGPDLFSPQPL